LIFANQFEILALAGGGHAMGEIRHGSVLEQQVEKSVRRRRATGACRFAESAQVTSQTCLQGKNKY
jgi:hypothetical protein